MNTRAEVDSRAARVVWVTGATGALGSSVVAAALGQSWRVVAVTRRGWPGRTDPGLFVLRLDLSSRCAIDEAIEWGLSATGRVDAWVHCVGAVADRPVWSMPDAAWEQVMEVNLGTAMRLARALGDFWPKEGGHAVLVSSFAARQGHAGQSNYVAAKAGLLGLTQSLAREWGSRNVRVNAVMPGAMRSAMTAGLSEERVEALRTANTLGRLNHPEEVARFVLFLLSTENISGQVFNLDSRIAPWT